MPGKIRGNGKLGEVIMHHFFNNRYIHDEMYGVQLDPSGNYLLLGGSGDEYAYSETNADGWSSDIWVSYLVVVDTEVTCTIRNFRFCSHIRTF